LYRDGGRGIFCRVLWGVLLKRGSVAALSVLGVLMMSGCSSYSSEGAATTDNGSYVDTTSGDYSGPSYGSEDFAPYADAQDAWDNEDGPDWEAFNDAYLTGWEEGCDTAFEDSPDGALYDQGEQFTADDCYANEPVDASETDVPYEVPDDPEEAGGELGMQDGCESAFNDLPSDGGGALYYGEDEYDDSICPVSSY
jgi:hypothetical protein